MKFFKGISAFDFGGKHLNGGMGASAPIITSKDFNRAEKINNNIKSRRRFIVFPACDK
jgi:hypothetical protein